MKVIFVGDIVGRPGREAAARIIPLLKKEKGADFVLANGENAAAGFGLTPGIVAELFAGGIDALTSGNHIWDKKEVMEVIDAEKRILRPANYPQGNPGNGWGVYETADLAKIAVINLEGRVFMKNIDCPFRTAKKIVEECRAATHNIIVDMHAEATSEKNALARFLDGRVTAVIGTHTHVQTADEQILEGGTGYITDAGMTGPKDSIIGIRSEQIIERFLKGMPTRFEVADKKVSLEGVFLTIENGKTTAIERIRREFDG